MSNKKVYAIRFLDGKYVGATGGLCLFNIEEVHKVLKYYRNIGMLVTFERVIK